MKAIEIVLATHGENLFWASGLESIITEYSTKEQSVRDDKRKKAVQHSLHEVQHLQLNARDIFEFVKTFRKMAEIAREVKAEIEEALETGFCKNGQRENVLTGHRVVKLQNDPNLNEANHFLSHIINSYNELAECTAFLQGEPSDHVGIPEKQILRNLGKGFSCLPSSCKRSLAETGHDLLARELAERLLKKKVSKTEWSAGGCFMASREVIQKNPISWYKMVLDEAKAFKDAKFALERIWAIVIRPDEDWS